ncbi:MAG TPA: hypothetical protein VGZ00_05945 [Candidatus Baltobacteraceae bacterium]|jgi:hypothetical protein|nr:hypothetical protein [Candidatus Baltobacteraceae bacterium]
MSQAPLDVDLQQILVVLNDPRPAAVAPRNPGPDRSDEYSVGRALSGPKAAGNPAEDRRANRALFAAKLREHVPTLRKNAREWLERNPNFIPTNVTVVDNRYTTLGGYSQNTTGPQPITVGTDLDSAKRIDEVMAVVDRELAGFYKQTTRLENFGDLIASQNPGRGPHKDTDHTIRVEFSGLKGGLEESAYILSTPPSQHELNADKRIVMGSLDLDTGYFDPMRGRFKTVVVYPDPDGRFKDVIDAHAAGMIESRTAQD